MASFVESWETGPSSTKFYCRTYIAPDAKAVLVFLHGFIEHIARYEHVFPLWVNGGVSVFAFDQRGFGRTATDRKEKSPGVEYGKFSRTQQLEDAEWAIKYVKSKYPQLPVFLMGHSMGGGLALSFVTRPSEPPAKSTVSLLSGVIASAPLILQAAPTPKIVRWIGGSLSRVTPNLVIPAPVKPEDLCHDPEVVKAYSNDPLVKPKGSLQGIDNMLTGGENLLQSHQHWPKTLPLLVVHGTEDHVTSFAASQQFWNQVAADDKHFTPYKGGFHELHNEPDGVKEKEIQECVSWVLTRAQGSSGGNDARL